MLENEKGRYMCCSCNHFHSTARTSGAAVLVKFFLCICDCLATAQANPVVMVPVEERY